MDSKWLERLQGDTSGLTEALATQEEESALSSMYIQADMGGDSSHSSIPSKIRTTSVS